jgi:hypothetical protein
MRALARTAIIVTSALALAAAVACGSSDQSTATQPPASRPASQPTATRVATAAPTPGPLKPFTLPRAGGGELSLADYLGRQPVNVVFYRGFF